jgi:GT2 family glycosyltransferase
MFSIVIPSKNATNLVACIKAIREAGETARIIVVDDGVDWTTAASITRDVKLSDSISGPKPFVFARNVNLGIQATGEDDVVVLNDDALLKTERGLTLMADRDMGVFGLIAAACNTVGNENQFQRPGGVLRTEPRMVCFVCVYIPRSTINKVGLLDERFVDYGMDDDDYCLRVRNAGLKIGIYDGCFVDHGSLTSSYRGGPAPNGDFRPNLRRFIAKWGTDNRGKSKEQSEWAHLWPEELSSDMSEAK